MNAASLSTISTRWLRGGPELQARARALLDAGFNRLVLDPEIRRPDLEALIAFFPRRSIGVLELFAPLPPPSAKGLLPPPRFASLDPDEERAAQRRARDCLEAADQHEIRAVAIPILQTEEPAPTELERLLSGTRRPTARHWELLRAKRAASAAVRKQLDALLRGVERLLRDSERFDIEILVRPAGLICELPVPLELDELRREFRGARLGVLAGALDLERARWCGLEGAEGGLERAGDALRGIVVEDGDLQRRGLAPGAGQVEWQRFEALARGAGAAALEWILDLRVAPDAEVLDAARRHFAALATPPKPKPRSILELRSD